LMSLIAALKRPTPDPAASNNKKQTKNKCTVSVGNCALCECTERTRERERGRDRQREIDREREERRVRC
jgi:hypothetical protein